MTHPATLAAPLAAAEDRLAQAIRAREIEVAGPRSAWAKLKDIFATTDAEREVERTTRDLRKISDQAREDTIAWVDGQQAAWLSASGSEVPRALKAALDHRALRQAKLSGSVQACHLNARCSRSRRQLLLERKHHGGDGHGQQQQGPVIVVVHRNQRRVRCSARGSQEDRQAPAGVEHELERLIQQAGFERLGENSR